MNTPLMELIDRLNNHLLNKYGQYSTFELGLIKDIRKDATELLEKERDVIEKAYAAGLCQNSFSGVSTAAKKMASDYYTKTFTNESK